MVVGQPLLTGQLSDNPAGFGGVHQADDVGCGVDHEVIVAPVFGVLLCAVCPLPGICATLLNKLRAVGRRS